MIENLFVYGSLAPGQANEHMLNGLSGSWEIASVRGEMHPQGWGKTDGYPGLYLDPFGGEVMGYIFRSDKLGAYWDTLDDFEGDAYIRCLTQVKRTDGTHIEAYVYTVKASRNESLNHR